jgi:hypothetical protein
MSAYDKLVSEIANNLHSVTQYCLADTQSIIRIDYEGKFVEATIYKDSPNKASIDLIEDGVSIAVSVVTVSNFNGLLDSMMLHKEYKGKVTEPLTYTGLANSIMEKEDNYSIQFSLLEFIRTFDLEPDNQYEGLVRVKASYHRFLSNQATLSIIEGIDTISKTDEVMFDSYEGLIESMRTFVSSSKETLELYTSTTFDELEFIPWACKKIESKLGLAVGEIKYAKGGWIHFDVFPDIDKPLDWATVSISITPVDDEGYPYNMEGVRLNIKGVNDGSNAYPLAPLNELPSELSFDHVLDCILKEIGL